LIRLVIEDLYPIFMLLKHFTRPISRGIIHYKNFPIIRNLLNFFDDLGNRFDLVKDRDDYGKLINFLSIRELTKSSST
jgi:hypothetical protein